MEDCWTVLILSRQLLSFVMLNSPHDFSTPPQWHLTLAQNTFMVNRRAFSSPLYVLDQPGRTKGGQEAYSKVMLTPDWSKGERYSIFFTLFPVGRIVAGTHEYTK